MTINGGKTKPGQTMKFLGWLLIAAGVALYVLSYSQGGSGGIGQLFMLFLGALLLIVGYIKGNGRAG